MKQSATLLRFSVELLCAKWRAGETFLTFSTDYSHVCTARMNDFWPLWCFGFEEIK